MTPPTDGMTLRELRAYAMEHGVTLGYVTRKADVEREIRIYATGGYGSFTDEERSAFRECLRVLRPGGTLVFKWYEYHIPLKDVLACCPARPLLGNRRPRTSKTHWVLFMREED